MEIVALYRVSTQRQGQSGLGLEAQRARVEAMAAERGARIVAEFVEVESGRKTTRPKLTQALEEARKRGAVVAVAKLDRLARDAEFVLRLSREAAANGLGGFLFCDLPEVDATTSAGRLILTVMASVAEFEARRISERTKDALAAAAARGRPLGAQLEPQARRNEERAQKAQEAAQGLEPIIRPMRERGDSLATIAEALTAAGVKTTGDKEFVAHSHQPSAQLPALRWPVPSRDLFGAAPAAGSIGSYGSITWSRGGFLTPSPLPPPVVIV